MRSEDMAEHSRHLTGTANRLALLYSDSSITVFAHENTDSIGRDIAEVCEARDEADRNESRPGSLTRIARVRVEVLEIVDDPTAKAAANLCPKCGK